MMFEKYQAHLQKDIPHRPGAFYAHLIVLRKTESFAVFKTDGELNTALVPGGTLESNQKLMTRLAIFKRKQTTPERLTGRELLRRYQVVGEECLYNEDFCGKCPDCILYGYAIGDSGSEKSKVYVDTCYSLTDYDESHQTFTLNAPYEDGTMTKGDKTTNRFSDQDHVKPAVYFPSVVTVRDATAAGLGYVLNNIMRTKRYGAQTTRTGQMSNEVAALIFADGEIFSNLRLTQAVYDRTAGKGSHTEILAATVAAAQELVKHDGVVPHLITGEQLALVLAEAERVFTSEPSLGTFLRDLAQKTQEYAALVGGKDAGKDDKKKPASKGKSTKKPDAQEP